MFEEEIWEKTEGEEIANVPVYTLINCLLVTAARSMPRGFRESEEHDIRAISSFCGSDEGKISLGKVSSAGEAGEPCCNRGKKGVGSMKGIDERLGIRRDGAGWEVDVSNC